MRNLAIAGGAFVAFLLAFVVALHVHFPGDAAKDRLAWEVQRGSQGQWLIEAEDASLYRLTGLSVEDAVLYKKDRVRRRGTAEGDDGPKGTPATPVLRVDELSVRARLLPLLRGQQAAGFQAALYGGTVDGDVALTDTTTDLRVLAEEIDLARVPLEGEEWSVDATGKVRLDADVFYDTENLKKSTGKVSLEFADLVFQEASVMGMTLEPTPFSEAALAFEIDKGKARVERGQFTSEPVDITVEGEIVLNKSFTRSRLKLKLLVRFSDQFDRLAKLAPGMKDARDDKGTYHFRVTGTLDNPRLREESQGRKPRRPRVDARPARVDRDADDDVNSVDEEADERRARRRERIEARRQRMLERRKARGEDGDGGPMLRNGRPIMPGELDDMGPAGPRRLPRVTDNLPVGQPGDPDEGEFIDGPPPQDEFFDPDMGPDGFGPPGGPDDFGPDDFGPDGDFGPDDGFGPSGGFDDQGYDDPNFDNGDY